MHCIVGWQSHLFRQMPGGRDLAPCRTEGFCTNLQLGVHRQRDSLRRHAGVQIDEHKARPAGNGPLCDALHKTFRTGNGLGLD